MKLPANFKTTLTGGLQAIFSALVAGTLTFPTDWSNPKQLALFACVVIGTFFGISFGLQAKDKNVTGGSVQQTMTGAVAKEGTQNLVDQTLIASKASGEELTLEQHEVLSDLKKEGIK